MKYYLVTLGCQMNIADSGRVEAYLKTIGYEKTDSIENADLAGIIACSVRQKAIDKVYNLIAVWNRKKKSHAFTTFLTGCVLPADKEKFSKQFNLVFDMRDLPKLANMLNKATVSLTDLKSARPVQAQAMNSFWELEGLQTNPVEAFIPIQNGCDKFCTYCAVPYTRGREVSRNSNDIIDEVKKCVDNNYKCITLLGQNVNSYGLDKEGKELNFTKLLEQIGIFGNQSDKEFRVYFTSPHPRDMTTDLLEVIAKYPVLAKQIHIPLQSGDSNMLERMNRKYDINHYRMVIENIKRILPTATIFTDIIVGFTGETDQEFENTRAALLEFKYNMAFIAMYSPRPGAVSSKWVDDVDCDEKHRRYAVLSDDLKKVSREYINTMIGKTFRILITGNDRQQGYLSGLTEGRIAVRFKPEQPLNVGTFVDVKITKASDFSAEGDII